MTKTYDGTFYSEQVDGSSKSAQAIVPYILELTRAKSVVDVGCGLGTWLASYAQCGVSDYLGLDGAWVSSQRLRIPDDNFRAVDLSQPRALGRRFDLVQSLEVAEHLPLVAAESFVNFLTGAADIVVFSAASPFQGGTHHINEQWPEFWQRLFDERGYLLFDVFRPTFWSNAQVEWWYAQNMFLYVSRERATKLPACAALGDGFKYPARVVHPHRIDPAYNSPPGLRSLILSAPRMVANAAKQSFSRPIRHFLAS